MTPFDLAAVADWVFSAIGRSRDDFESGVRTILDSVGGEVSKAGQPFLDWFVREFEAKLGTKEIALATGKQVFADLFGERPSYNPDHFWGA